MSASARPSPGPSPASPWVIDTRTLGRRPGSMRTVRVAVPATERIGNEVVGVPAAGPDVNQELDDASTVDLDLRLESVAEGVLVSGTAAATAQGQCARCLIDVTEPVVVTIRELYAYPDSATAATTEDDEVERLVDDLVDLQSVVRDEIVLALPLAPLCRPDCLGLCPDCGDRFDDLEPGHSHEILDPRWAALQEKFAPRPDQTGPAGSAD